MLLKVKDLKKFLITNKVPISRSQTKMELAQLVVSHLQNISHDIPRTASFDGLGRSTGRNNREIFSTSTISENDLSNQTRNVDPQDSSLSNTSDSNSQGRNNVTQGLFARRTVSNNSNRNANKSVKVTLLVLLSCIVVV